MEIGFGRVLKAACGAVLLAFSVSAQAEVHHLFRVDDHVYSGTQPNSGDFPELARMGIRTVLDLRGGPIHKPREQKTVEAAGMQYLSIRLSGFWEPKDRQIARILAVLQDPARGPVFIHCRRGHDRTGMVVACNRMAHDHWTNAQALEEARYHGLFPLELLMRRYIQKFDPSRVSGRPGMNAAASDASNARP